MLDSTSSQDLRLHSPDTVCLDKEHFSLAQQTSDSEKTDFNTSWQIYINTLALVSFEVWLQQRLNDKFISRDISTIKIAGNLQVDDFRFCAIATEHILSQTVRIPSLVVEKLEYRTHFYVLLEVLEEEEQVVIRGFLPYNQLVNIKNNLKLSINDGCYEFPLSLFDIEPNHLFLYQRYVSPSEFLSSLEENKHSQINQKLSNIVVNNTTKLSQWLQGVFDRGWQTLDSLYKPERNLAFGIRNIDDGTNRTKIIDLGISLDSNKFALILHIFTDEKDNYNQGKINVLVQLRPADGNTFLPQNIKLVLISKAGVIVQEVASTDQDNCIQLNIYKGEPGKTFSIQVSLANLIITEKFEL